MKKILLFTILILLFSDLLISFNQYLNLPTDGDLAPLVVPSKGYSKVLHDPLGISASIYHEKYEATNRFWNHISIKTYFNYAPIFFQNFFNPIESLYYSIATANIIFQILIITFLSIITLHFFKFDWLSFICLGFFYSSFFHQTAFYPTMGIIDKCISYSFAYAFPFSILLFFIFIMLHNTNKTITYTLGIFLCYFLTFSSPLVAPSFLILIFTFFLYQFKLYEFKFSNTLNWFNSINSQKKLIIYLLVIFSIYSFYTGTFNIENSTKVSLLFKYKMLFIGIFNQFTQRIGLTLIVTGITINYFIIKKLNLTTINKSLNQIYFTLIIFSLIYTFLLPFGGFREYRPEIIRRDTFLPVILFLIFTFGLQTIYIIKNVQLSTNNFQKLSILPSLIVFLIFYSSDLKNENDNNFEKNLLIEIQNSNQKTIGLKSEQLPLCWKPFSIPIESEVQSQFLYNLKITKTKILYYQKTE